MAQWSLINVKNRKILLKMGKWIYQSNEVDETKIKLKMEKWINELKQQGNYVKMAKKNFK